MKVFACQMIGQPWPCLFGVYSTEKKAQKALESQEGNGRWTIEKWPSGWALVLHDWPLEDEDE